MPYCPGCGAVNSEDVSNCAACGRVLGIQCPRCKAPNQTASKFCRQCGEQMVIGVAGRLSGVDGEPIAEMMSEQAHISPDTLPRDAFLKIVLGGFVFALLYLSQALSGSPVLAILAGLGSGIVCLWGLVDMALWAMDRSDGRDRRGKVAASDLLEPLPEGAS